MKLARALGSVGGLTLASRVLALVRDSLAARYVGAGFASDAFNGVAFRLPNMFRALFAEGAFSAAFIPMFNRKAAGPGGVADGYRFAERALAVLLPVLVVFTALLIAAAWPITWALSGGFSRQNPTPEQFAFAVTLSRITLPYLALISLASLLGGILNSLDKFWVNAAAPILLNIAMIAGLWLFHGADEYETAQVQAISVTVGGALQLLWLIWACRRAGVSMKLKRPRLDADVKELLRLIVPAAAGAGASQINLLISTALSGWLLASGSITYIYYADRLNQLPLGLIGIGLGTILLPTISRLLSTGQEQVAMDTQNRGIELALFLTLPATVAFITVAEPIVRGLFQYGRFTALDAERCGWALSAFSIGLPSYVLVKVLTPGYYARGDTRTPVRYAMLSILINIVGNIVLIPLMGHVGPPLATALSSTVNVAMLYSTLVKRGHFAADGQLRRRLPRLAVAAVVMGGALYAGEGLLDPWLGGVMVQRYVALAVLVGAGIALYGVACFLTGAYRLSDLKALMRRKSATKTENG
ncbi:MULTISPECIES: murein biosynthesis integral membrane protein MurJ [Sphingobium]|uniref:Probable lipid II flippase MurJ n=1 Tax=Sphingobium fuliginis (strain ATCC 27551) TaxID=336203 RepID=A0ABQ1ESE8_SPHSA|nr:MULTISPECIES: murein biosynthesis integral membrane protein MurJ [Sphingobium]AJR24596.1 membrane protein [Sphingobium sp. YBL2]RYL99524.1 murein biosynthesis integral membrane protein MurJ [Sphingobium fuliginis]WDA36652.1 murein biosynthesis integral membrane protein MurJ [Sphingobium sp. YC-XJ3]GFZ85302.1 putative lipid II flippase MurJ [Sphingobium fuliginis]